MTIILSYSMRGIVLGGIMETDNISKICYLINTTSLSIEDRERIICLVLYGRVPDSSQTTYLLCNCLKHLSLSEWLGVLKELFPTCNLVFCPKCGNESTKYGFKDGKQRYRCKVCKYQFYSDH